MKLNAYLQYAVLISCISIITQMSAYQVRIVNTTDGEISAKIDIALASLICPNREIPRIAPQSEASIETIGCCVQAIHIQGISGPIQGQTAGRGFGTACQNITLIVRKNNDNTLSLE